MTEVSRGLTLVSFLLALLTGCGVAAYAQAPLSTTTVADTVYNASGAPASGTVLVSWSAFTAASGASIPAGNTSASITANGALSISLAPNAGATPIGSYYTATFHLNDGTTSRQYWVIPITVAGGGPAKLAAIQNSVLPTSVAMQTVSKAYVDNAIAAAVTGAPLAASSPYVMITGDTMTGPLVLPGDPVSPLQAADKNYVDANVTAVASGLGSKVSLLPSATQNVTQPSGTQLDVNLLNGEVYANEYVSAGSDGIQNALNTADCVKGCDVKVPPTYVGIDTGVSSSLPNAAAVIDQRGGAVSRTTKNPMPVGTNSLLSEAVTQEATISAPQLQALHPGAVGVSEYAMSLTTNGLTGGSNLFPGNIETVPNAKDTFYEMLRGRLVAINPERTVVIRGLTRPAVLVEENELVTEFLLPDCFRLRWLEESVDTQSAIPLVTMQCAIEYETAGTGVNAGMDRGRTLAAMDAELFAALSMQSQHTPKYSYAPLVNGKPAAAMNTQVWWSEPAFGKVERNRDRIARTATVAVMSYQEGGER